MSLFLTFLRFEYLLQWRSLRFRAGVIVYLLLCAVGPIWISTQARQDGSLLGMPSYLHPLQMIQPFLSVILAAVVAGNRTNHASRRDLRHVLGSARLSSVSYLLHRWMVLIGILFVIVAIPFAIACAVAISAEAAPGRIFDHLGSWSLRIFPVTLWAATLWLALVMILGGELVALAVSFLVGALGLAMLNRLGLPLHWHIDGIGSWIGFQDAINWINNMARWQDPYFRSWISPILVTESPYDFKAAFDYWLPRGLLAMGFAAFSLGLATAYVGRGRPNLKPMAIADHPLRTFLATWAQLRERHAADATLPLMEKVAIGTGTLALALAFLGLIDRHESYRASMEARYLAETEAHYAPTALGLRARSCKVRGSLHASGRLDTRVSCSFENQGEESASTLAFTVAPELAIELAPMEGRQTTVKRSWDRLSVRFSPLLKAGEGMEVSFRLQGSPEELRFSLRSWSGMSFAQNYRGWRDARFPRDLSDLSRSSRRLGMSRRRVRLVAEQLLPVPRYTPWTLTKNGDALEVSAEGVEVTVPLEFDLEMPDDWILVDVCGNSGSGGRFHGTCAQPLHQVSIRGGRLVNIAAPGENLIAVLPEHQEHARRQLGVLSTAASVSEQAWPGLDGLRNIVIIEWPPAFEIDPRRGMNRFTEEALTLDGQMLLVKEHALLFDRPLSAEDLAADILVQQLLNRRALNSEQRLLFRNILRSLMIRRMGKGRKDGAAIELKPIAKFSLKTPLLSASQSGFNDLLWKHRLPALLYELESRVGTRYLYAGIEAFLSTSSEEAGSVREMLAAIEEVSAMSLEQMYQDYFVSAELPELSLTEVAFRPISNLFVVTGGLRNEKGGEALCPVVVKTELGDRRIQVLVGPESVTSFELETPGRPHTVVLDPETRCHRFRHGTWAARERISLVRK